MAVEAKKFKRAEEEAKKPAEKSEVIELKTWREEQEERLDKVGELWQSFIEREEAKLMPKKTEKKEGIELEPLTGTKKVPLATYEEQLEEIKETKKGAEEVPKKSSVLSESFEALVPEKDEIKKTLEEEKALGKELLYKQRERDLAERAEKQYKGLFRARKHFADLDIKKPKTKLEKELKPGARVISYVFPFEGWDYQIKDKPTEDHKTIYLYQR